MANKKGMMKMSKFLLLVICSLLFFSNEALGQSPSRMKEMLLAKERLMEASFQMDSVGIVDARKKFELYVQGGATALTARYYIAFANWQMALRHLNRYSASGRDEVVRLMDEARVNLKSILTVDSTFTEAYILGIQCSFPLIRFVPSRRAEILDQIAAWKQKAFHLQPDNPRLILTDAHDIFNKPKNYGGSQEKGIARYHDAIVQFERQPLSPGKLLPDWGHEIACAWLGLAYLSGDNPDLDDAKKYFEKAIKLRQDFAFANDMLVQVDKRLNKKAEKSR